MEFTLHQIKSGNLLDFELRKESHKYTGYTLFLAFFYHEWKVLTREEQCEEIGFLVRDDDSDYDSVDSIPDMQNSDVIRHAANKWMMQSDNRKKSWGILASRLNTQPVLGRFESVPTFVDDDLMCESLNMDWRHTCKVLKCTISKEASRSMSQMNYSMSFPGIRTQVGSCSFRRSYMSTIILLCIFGKDYSKLHDHEIILRKKW